RRYILLMFFFSSRRRHTRSKRDWSSDVCSSDLKTQRVSPICALARVSSPHLFYGCGKSVNVFFSGVERTHPAHFIARGIPVVEVEVLAQFIGNAVGQGGKDRIRFGGLGKAQSW